MQRAPRTRKRQGFDDPSAMHVKTANHLRAVLRLAMYTPDILPEDIVKSHGQRPAWYCQCRAIRPGERKFKPLVIEGYHTLSEIGKLGAEIEVSPCGGHIKVRAKGVDSQPSVG